MARKPRIHVPGGLYHVILRGNAKQKIFFTVADRAYLYALLAEGVSRFGYRVHAFCLMSNHLHLALQAGESPLSAGIQNLSFRYTRYLNKARNRIGHLFQGRFKAYLVDQDSYGLELVRYIHLNPVRAKLVKTPQAYRWSSHRAYLGEQKLDWLTTDWVLGQFAPTAGIARRRFAAFVAAGQDEGHSDRFYGGEADTRVVGEADFVKKVLPKKTRVAKPPALSVIVRKVCKSASLTEAALRARGKDRPQAHARALIGWLAIKSGSATLTEVAARFNREASTLSHAVTNLEKRSRQSESFANSLSRHLYALYQA